MPIKATTQQAVPVTPRRPARGPLPYVMAAVMLILLGMFLHLPQNDAVKATPTIVYPTLTPKPTDTPLIFPDSLLAPDTPLETAVALMTGGTPLATLASNPTPVPTVPLPTATPVPLRPTPPPPTQTPVPTSTRPASPVQGSRSLQPTATPSPVLVWRYTSAGWDPADGRPIHFHMRRGDFLLGSALISGGPSDYTLMSLQPVRIVLHVTPIRAPVLIAWTAPADSDYNLTFIGQDPHSPSWVHVDMGVYRPPD